MNFLCVCILVVAAITIAPVHSQISENGNQDRFKELFESEAPINEIVNEMATIEPAALYEHFTAVLKHIQNKDKHASYAKTLIATGQKILNHILSEIGHKGEVDFVKFIKSANDVMNQSPTQDPSMAILLFQVCDYVKKLSQQALDEAKRSVIEKLLKATGEVPARKAKASPPKKTRSSVSSAPSSSNNSTDRKLRRGRSRKGQDEE